jgi:hypothetical protein
LQGGVTWRRRRRGRTRKEVIVVSATAAAAIHEAVKIRMKSIKIN